MINIALFVDNSNIKDIVIDEIENGNPGIGGTEYQMFLFAIKLSITYNQLFNVFLLITKDIKSFKHDNYLTIIRTTHNHLRETCLSNNINILYIRNFELIDPVDNMKIICVMNNFLEISVVQQIMKRTDVFFHFLSRSSIYNYYTIKRIYLRSIIAPHFIKDTKDRINHETIPDKFIIGFIGALVPMKSFDIIASLWDEIYSKIPNAELWVFGSGNLYFNNKQLGYYGIASDEYENKIIELIHNKNAWEAIKWYGSLSHKELKNKLKNVDIGLVNPSGRGETFCLSIFDFITNNIPVLLNKNVMVYREVTSNQALFFEEYECIPQILANYHKGILKNKKIKIRYDDSNTLRKMEKAILRINKNKNVGSIKLELLYSIKRILKYFYNLLIRTSRKT